VERTTWTAAAVVLAADALAGATGGAQLFTDPAALPTPETGTVSAGWLPGSAGTVRP
jgi:hypothetical protein